MRGAEVKIVETVAEPDRVVESLSDGQVELYYRWYERTPVGAKFLCVVVKFVGGDAFVVTSYLTDTVKKGHRIWPEST